MCVFPGLFPPVLSSMNDRINCAVRATAFYFRPKCLGCTLKDLVPLWCTREIFVQNRVKAADGHNISYLI